MNNNGKKWNEVPQGQYQTGISALMTALGRSAGSVIDALNADSTYVRSASHALVNVLSGHSSRRKAGTVAMMDIKQLMGSRCFLASEVAQIFDMTEDEERLIPEIDPATLKKLARFLQATGTLQNEERWKHHVLFPLPGVIKGQTVDLNSLPRLSKDPGVMVDLASADGCIGTPRVPRWYLLYIGTRDAGIYDPKFNITDYEGQINNLLPNGYMVPDPMMLTFGRILWYRRMELSVLHAEHIRTSATGWGKNVGQGRILVGGCHPNSFCIHIESPGTNPLLKDIAAILPLILLDTALL